MQLPAAIVDSVFARYGLAISPIDAISDPIALNIRFDYAQEALIFQVTRLRQSAELTLDPLTGLHAWQARTLASRIDLPIHVWEAFCETCLALYRCFTECDALDIQLAPIDCSAQPFRFGGGALALDDHALFRQHSLVGQERVSAPALIVHTADAGVACIANGAGLLMEIVDGLQALALRPGCLIEMTAPLSADLLAQSAERIPLSADGVLISLFCDSMSAPDLLPALIPIAAAHPNFVVLLEGLHAGTALDALRQAGVTATASLYDALEFLQSTLSHTPE